MDWVHCADAPKKSWSGDVGCERAREGVEGVAVAVRPVSVSWEEAELSSAMLRASVTMMVLAPLTTAVCCVIFLTIHLPGRGEEGTCVRRGWGHRAQHQR